ncbi:Macrolide export protein MacA [Stieleria neptunia]|uniref:Macrolide export protein MacA n=1 Tax=Stieleria neptunia TaxID=2527979 RepID=A0A518HIX8_9BACT|nr:HlyD family efflux transporter periplasmic adaptor subunit [Stieleria neptunia]QDV40806.1 Macrolide export protein MacA [Stieleria neptunia]
MTSNPSRGVHRRAGAFAFLVACFAVSISGCDEPTTELREKAPLPVTVMTLSKTVPQSSYSASGSVKSWKTEDLGFEVSGRVEWVLEPGEDIDGRLVDPQDKTKVIMEGTKLAQIESARYEIALQSAEADLEVAILGKEEIEIQLNESLPAQIESAEADLELAKAEYERNKKLESRNATSQSELEQAKNLVATRSATLLSLSASKKQAQAQLKSADAQIKRARQALRDAQRDLDNTVLYGSYQGQISKVSVVPGSVVSAGSPVLTLQMTNPIKVEVELSAKQSRKMRTRRSLPASFALPDGSTRQSTAFVYNIDPSADPTTRTFTMTLLMLNERFADELAGTIDKESVVRSEDLWPIRLNQMMGTDEGVILVEEKSIRNDEAGSYVYLVTNAKHDEVLPPILKVRRQGIVKNDLLIPFLGNWSFQSITFVDPQGDPESVDPDALYVGLLEDGRPLGPNWDGESVVLDGGSQWMLRPGDLVNIDLSEEGSELGFHVPVEAIFKTSDTSSLFVVRNGRVDEIPVTLVPGDNLDEGSMMQVMSPELREGMQVVRDGVHLLRSGQTVNVVGPSGQASVATEVN